MTDSPVTLDIRPVAGRIGADIHGIDLSTPLSNAEATAIRDALNAHKVIFFPGQALTPEQQLTIGRLFGEPRDTPHVASMPGYPAIIEIVKEPEETNVYNFGGDWHTDMTYLDEPAKGAVFYALEVPPAGGDTIWANMCAAYDSLSDGMKELLGGMRAVHSGARSYGTSGKYTGDVIPNKTMTVTPSEEADRGETVHPVVRTIPETGQKSLYINPNYTVRFEDMTEEESKPLLDYLVRHAQRDELCVRYRWSAGTVAVWDNRCTMHRALNDYDGHRRVARRVTIGGDRVVA